MHAFPFQSLRRSRAFTLIEVLVVLAIMAIISSLALPAINNAFRSYQLDSTGQIMVNQLSLARQTALSRGHAVQVRFYLLPDYNTPTTGAPSVYRGMQSLIESDPVQSSSDSVSVATTPLVKPVFFQAPVIISSVMTPTSVSPLLPATATAADTTNPLPVYGLNYKYVLFHFKPDGSTDLTSPANSLSLVLENDRTAAGGLPANFQTISIDPLNGAVRGFRP
jgi:uncharacterized protein (TIGR02596 family)